MSEISVGSRAPDFTATASDGRTIRLSDYAGRKGLVLFFYPKDGSHVCTAEACAFRDSYDRFQAAGFDVIGVSGDSDAAHRRFGEQHRLPFPLISDRGGDLRRLFAVPKILGLIPGRATYVIDQTGIIRLIFSAMLASDEHVHQAIEAIGDPRNATSGGRQE